MTLLLAPLDQNFLRAPTKEPRMKMNPDILLKTLLCSVLVLLVGTSFAGASSRNSGLQDSWLTSKTKIALAADERVKGTDVSVETSKSVVTLRGKVDSDDARDAALAVARGVDGVKKVNNDLQVVAPSRRDSIDERDEAITARIKDKISMDADLMNDSRLQSAGIDVVTNAGVVSLTGDVPDIIVSSQASWTAWQVRGVKSVRNDLKLVGKKGCKGDAC